MKKWYIFKKSTNDFIKTNDLNKAVKFVVNNKKDIIICNTSKKFDKVLALHLIKQIKK